jgi:virginiamycin B lyase
MALAQQRSERMRPLPTTLVGMLGLVAALLVLSLALAPRAEAFVYWMTNPGDLPNPKSTTIGRANLDGSRADQRFITTGSSAIAESGLAIDGAHVYWTNSETGTIGRANLDGTRVDQSFIAGAGRPIGVAVDGAHVYWVNMSRTNENPYGDAIGRANLDGSGVDPSFITGPSFLTGGLAVDAAHIYWADDYEARGINRAKLDGSSVERGFISVRYPSALAVDAEHVYWAAPTSAGPNPIGPSFPGAIGRANLDGSGVDQGFITGATAPTGVAVDAAHIYWINYTGKIGRANLDGSGVDQSFISPGAGLVGDLAVNFSVGKVRKANDKGTAKLTVEVPAPGKIALAQTKKLKGAEVRAKVAGEVQLPIKPRGRAKNKLAHKGKVKIRVEVTYAPDGGEPSRQTTALKLIKRG